MTARISRRSLRRSPAATATSPAGSTSSIAGRRTTGTASRSTRQRLLLASRSATSEGRLIAAVESFPFFRASSSSTSSPTFARRSFSSFSCAPARRRNAPSARALRTSGRSPSSSRPRTALKVVLPTDIHELPLALVIDDRSSSTFRFADHLWICGSILSPPPGPGLISCPVSEGDHLKPLLERLQASEELRLEADAEEPSVLRDGAGLPQLDAWGALQRRPRSQTKNASQIPSDLRGVDSIFEVAGGGFEPPTFGL